MEVERRTTSSCVPARPSPSPGLFRAAGRRPGRSGPGPWVWCAARRRSDWEVAAVAHALVRCRAGRFALPAVGAVVEASAVTRAARMRAF